MAQTAIKQERCVSLTDVRAPVALEFAVRSSHSIRVDAWAAMLCRLRLPGTSTQAAHGPTRRKPGRV